MSFKEEYKELLNDDNQELFVKIARINIKHIINTAVGYGLIRPYNLDEINSTLDFNEVCELFKSLRLESNISKGEKYWISQIGTNLHHALRKKRLRRSPQEYNILFRLRCQQLPNLYGVLLEHRNMQAHSQAHRARGYDPGTNTHFMSLCSTILSILDLSCKKPDGVLDLEERVCDFVEMLAGEILKDRIEEEGEDEKAQDKSEMIIGLRNALDESEKQKTSLREISTEQKKIIEELKQKNGRLRERLDNENPAGEKLVKFIEEKSEQLIQEFQEASKEMQSGNKKVMDHVSDAMEGIENTVEGIESKIKSEELINASSDSEYEEEDDGDFEESDDEEDEYEDDEEEDFDEDDEEEEIDRLTPLMAEAELRKLRNRIRREMDVEPWENICMIRPIVSEALVAAQYGGMNMIDDWKRVRNIERKYRRHRAIMDRQLAEYGEEMMEIYRRVERRYVDND